MMVVRDFNEVLKPEERKGNTVLSASIREFQEWQSNMDLCELSLLGIKFTWYRNNSASRIDRAFVDSEWFGIFKELKLWGLNRLVSYHSPLLVNLINGIGVQSLSDPWMRGF